jgi:hypothetical protein
VVLELKIMNFLAKEKAQNQMLCNLRLHLHQLYKMHHYLHLLLLNNLRQLLL